MWRSSARSFDRAPAAPPSSPFASGNPRLLNPFSNLKQVAKLREEIGQRTRRGAFFAALADDPYPYHFIAIDQVRIKWD
jgi:hypothetical protein